jgi:copper transport protein
MTATQKVHSGEAGTIVNRWTMGTRRRKVHNGEGRTIVNLWRGGTALVLAVLAVIFVLPGTALAHAELLSTAPLSGAVLDAPPSAITLTFNEPVEISLGGIQLYDGSGQRVDVGATHHPNGNDKVVSVSVSGLGQGSFVVGYQVISADSHPVQGAFSFQVGQTSDLRPGVITDIINSSHTSKPASIGLGISRGLIVGAIAIVFGGLIVAGLGIVDLTHRVRLIVAIWAGIGGVAGLLQLPLEVGYASGQGLSSLTDSSAWSAAFDSRIGVAWVIRAAIVAGFGAALLITAADRARPWWRGAALVGLVGVGLVSAYGGHGATGRWILVGVLVTALHVSAMAIWLGGLLFLVVERRGLTAAAARRFSALAFLLIGVVVASGVVQSVRQLETFDALTDTSYGTLLIWKVAFVVVLVAVAALSRRIVRRAPDDASMDVGRLGRAVVVESVVAVAIVVATSLLMAANPSQVEASRPFSATLTDGNYLASITLEPGRAGQNELHVYLNDAVSSLSEPDDVHVEISDPSRSVTALQIPVTRSGAGHYTTPTATFPYPASWTLTVYARYHTFDQVQFSTTVKIR